MGFGRLCRAGLIRNPEFPGLSITFRPAFRPQDVCVVPKLARKRGRGKKKVRSFIVGSQPRTPLTQARPHNPITPVGGSSGPQSSELA
jgi:hypothetical protein